MSSNSLLSTFLWLLKHLHNKFAGHCLTLIFSFKYVLACILELCRTFYSVNKWGPHAMACSADWPPRVRSQYKPWPGFHQELCGCLKNVWTSASLSSAKRGSFLASTDRIRLWVHVWMNEGVCVSAWKSLRVISEINVLIPGERLSLKVTCSESVSPSWDGEVQEQSVLAEDSVCQTNSRAGTSRCTVTLANDTAEQIASEPEKSKILVFINRFVSLPRRCCV